MNCLQTALQNCENLGNVSLITSVVRRPRISIIITTYNLGRMNDVAELLDSIKRQSYDNLETIVVAEGSTRLLHLISEHISNAAISTAQVVFNNGESGLCESRNLGIQKAKGDILAFTDDDVILPPDWAKEIAEAFTRDESVIALTGPAFPSWDDNSASWLPEELDWLLSCTSWCDWREPREVRNVWGFNMAFRREAFDSCGLFPTTLGYHRGPISEDLGFSMIVRTITGKRIVFNPMVKVWHKVHRYRLSPGFIAERAYWIGHSRRMLRTYYSGMTDQEDLLSPEHDLLRLIFRRLPTTLRSLRRFSITMLVLSFVALGYLLPNLPLIGRLSPLHRPANPQR